MCIFFKIYIIICFVYIVRRFDFILEYFYEYVFIYKFGYFFGIVNGGGLRKDKERFGIFRFF